MKRRLGTIRDSRLLPLRIIAALRHTLASASGTRCNIFAALSPTFSVRIYWPRALPAILEAGAVNLGCTQASTRVMAAGTTLRTMTLATAEEIALEEFSRIVESHRPQIFRFLMASTRDADLAETLTQECFLKAHRNWTQFRGDSTAMTWLMRIAINLQRDHWRNRRMQFWRRTQTNSVELDEASDWLPSTETPVEKQLIAREQVKQVWRIVKDLSERQRTVFLLRYVEERELSEIAQATGLSEGTVKAHLSRALTRIRAELGGKR